MPRVLLVDDEPKLLRLLARMFSEHGFRTSTATRAEEAVKLLQEEIFDLLVTDVRLPQMSGLDLLREARRLHPNLQVIVITAYGTVSGAVEAMRLGAFDYLLKPFELEGLALIAQRALETAKLRQEHEALRQERETEQRIIAQSPAMRRVMDLVERVAPAESTVLLMGESGAGKEVVAEAIQQRSQRRERAFVRVNCPAIPRDLLESELFGHVRGAFTGASAPHEGKFETADSGTIFLDEIGDLPLEQQGKILNVLERRSFERVGGRGEVHVDVRVIAATNRDLRARVAEGLFREDLFYRLNVVSVRVPPLRERGQDLRGLVDVLLHHLGLRTGRPHLRMSEEAFRALAAYPWPGNVRELRNALERAVVLSSHDTLQVEDLPPDIPTPGPLEEGEDVGPFTTAVEAFKRATLLSALRATHWRKGEAAERLGLSARAMSHYVRRYDLDAAREDDPEGG
ncbi:MAG: sigma-54 dependent transcriptional regulator [Pseudomonadota bacterium]